MFPVNKILDDGIKQDTQLIINNPIVRDLFSVNYIESLINNKTSINIFKWQREWMLWKLLIFSLWYDHFSKQ